MLLSEYFQEIIAIIDKYSQSGLIVKSDYANDFRTDKIGFIKGHFLFLDGSRLYFTEYVDVKYRIEKLAYSYHYQNKSGELLFRYDNAKHKPPLKYIEHKHLSNNEILISNSPNLKTVLNEISGYLL